MTDALLAILIILPIILTFFLKSNAALALLALTAGYSLDNLASSDISTGISNLKLGTINNVDLDLIILILPVILTLVFTARSWGGRTKMISQMLLAAATGLMLAIISLPFFSSILDLNLWSSKIWPLLQHIRASIIIFGVLFSLILIWLSKSHSHSKKHK